MELADHSSNPKLRNSYKARYSGLADRSDRSLDNSSSRVVWSQEELCDIISALQELLNSVEEPSSTMVAEVHCTIGVIHQRLNHDARATQSFLQALWVQTAMDYVAPDRLGLTKLRLALAYGRKGQNQEAISILASSLNDFQQAGLSEDHEFVLKANEALEAFQLASMHKQQRQNSRRISQGAA
jgi:hypothetical protein